MILMQNEARENGNMDKVVLRKLEPEDAAFMLEWMHDEDLVGELQTDFSTKTIEDCQKFIEESRNDRENIHLAVVNSQNEYLGTVSLKHINKKNGNAEFAIAMRKCALGKGYAKSGMEAILQKGYEELQLHAIYWCVGKQNYRAQRFYEKNGYFKIDPDKIEAISGYTEEQISRYIWFQEERT